MNKIQALTPLDGRYAHLVQELEEIFSEYGLMKNRLFVEVQWLKFLNDHFKQVENFKIDFKKIMKLLEAFDLEEAQKIKDCEKVTNHDVKAVEYYLKEKLTALGYDAAKEWVHFSCTSADINNTSYALMLKQGKSIVLEKSKELLEILESLAKKYKSLPMMSRTHGQPATPTTVGKEFINFAWRLKKEIINLENIAIQAKFNGATGNFNAHAFTFPKEDWISHSQKFISKYLLIDPILFSTQINPNNYISEMMHSLSRLASIVIDMDRDMWGYISFGYFKQKLKKGEVGSSTMPHKVNPIDFENSEGNMGLAISLAEHLSIKLLNSRFQRDLTDSTVSRNFGCVFGYILIGLKNIIKGFTKIDLNHSHIQEDLENNLELLAEPIQSVMRISNEDNPYEKLKELTRGVKISKEDLGSFIDSLKKVSKEDKRKMKDLTPATYIGLAEKLVDQYFF